MIRNHKVVYKLQERGAWMSAKKKLKKAKKGAKKIGKVIKKNPEIAMDIISIIIFGAGGKSKGTG